MNDNTRTVDELIMLGTYQGMTDEEVELVIAYRIARALESEEAKARAEGAVQGALEVAAAQQQAVNDSLQLLKTLTAPVSLGVVNYG